MGQNQDMPYNYYYQLSKARQRIYDKSDAINHITIADTSRLKVFVQDLQLALSRGQRGPVRSHCQNICNEVCRQLAIPRIKVKVETRRPSNDSYEMYGYYEPGQSAEEEHALTLWMYTAKRHQIVAFKTFLRTLLHEICHHIDYYHYHWDESFHTEGFYQRESSLYSQLVS